MDGDWTCFKQTNTRAIQLTPQTYFRYYGQGAYLNGFATVNDALVFIDSQREGTSSRDFSVSFVSRYVWSLVQTLTTNHQSPITNHGYSERGAVSEIRNQGICDYG